MITCSLNELSTIVKNQATKDSPFATVLGIGLFTLLISDAFLMSFGKSGFVAWIVSLAADEGWVEKYRNKVFMILFINIRVVPDVKFMNLGYF